MPINMAFWQFRLGDEKRLVEAAAFMDADECKHMISVARGGNGLPMREIVPGSTKARRPFSMPPEKSSGKIVFNTFTGLTESPRRRNGYC